MSFINLTARTIFLALTAFAGVACSNPDAQKQKHVERGDSYVAEQKYDHAILEYANAVRIDPKFGEARLKLAKTYEQSGNIRAAFPEYIRAADALPDHREAQLRAIQVLLLAGRFDDAKARSAALLAKDSKDVDALLLHASAMAAVKDPAGAVAQIEEALRVKPDDSRSYVALGAVRQSAGDPKQAEDAFRRAIALEPSSPDVQLGLGNFLWSQNRASEAEAAIKAALAIQPDHVLANRMLAALMMATERAGEAEEPLKKIVAASNAPETRLMLADYYLSVQRSKDATDLLTVLASNPATAIEAGLRLASIDYAAGNRTEADKRLDDVLARAPKYPRAVLLRAQWLLNESQLDPALEQAKAAVDADPQSAEAHFVLATVHQRRREFRDAITSYNEVLRLNPQAAAAQIELSRLHLASGNANSALQFAEDAARMDPRNLGARVALVRSLVARGDLVRAQTEIAQLVQAAPNEGIVHAMNGTLLMLRGELAAAKTAFEQALTLSPDSIEAVSGLVGLDLQAKRIDAAVGRIESQLARKPDSPELLALASQVFNAAGQPAKAEQALRHAIDANPRFHNGYALLAQLFIQQKRLDEARKEFETVVNRDPKDVRARTMVGLILEVQNKRGEAKAWYEATLKVSEDAPVVANNLAFIYADEGTNLDMALQLASAAKQRLPNVAEVDDTLGWIYYKKNLASLAVPSFEASIKQDPTRPEYFYHLGLTYAKLGDKAKARDALERALQINPSFPGSAEARSTLDSLGQTGSR